MFGIPWYGKIRRSGPELFLLCPDPALWVWLVQAALPANWTVKNIQQHMDEKTDGLDSDQIGNQRDATERDPRNYGV